MLQGTLNNRISAGVICVALAACGGSATTAETTNTTSGNSAASMPTAGSTNGGAQPAAVQADATQARFNQPMGLAVDAAGNLYAADTLNYTIRKVTPDGVVTTLAGSAGVSGTSDGIGAAARFSALKGIAVDGAGNIYAVDNGTVRKISPAGAVTTLAGAPGEQGNTDGAGGTARFNHPWGIASAPDGTLYVADTDNYLVRKVSPAGVVSTFAGTRGSRGTADGSTASATFIGPRGIARDAEGKLYVTDWYGPPAQNIPEGSTFIRKIAADGSVSTLAGNYGGEQGPALFSDTFAIAAGADGNVYVAALGSVRKVTASGAVSTLAGPSDDFQSLEGLSIGSDGTLFVADTPSHAISRVTQDGAITLYAGKPMEPGRRGRAAMSCRSNDA